MGQSPVEFGLQPRLRPGRGEAGPPLLPRHGPQERRARQDERGAKRETPGPAPSPGPPGRSGGHAADARSRDPGHTDVDTMPAPKPRDHAEIEVEAPPVPAASAEEAQAQPAVVRRADPGAHGPGGGGDRAQL